MKLKCLIDKYDTPLYVYSEEAIRNNYQMIERAFPYRPNQIHYAVMCNNYPDVLKTIQLLGGSVQINSLRELELVKKLGFKDEHISFTSIGLNEKSIKELINNQLTVNLDSLEEVEKYCKAGRGKHFGIRVNIVVDIPLEAGHTNSYRHTDVGIREQDFKSVKLIAARYGCKVIGVHGYLASNLLDSSPFFYYADYLKRCAKQFPDIEYINFGSGFGVFCDSAEKQFDFKKTGQYYSDITTELSTFFKRDIQLKIEPGRSLIAAAGILLAKVTNVKQLEHKRQVAINVGFGGFARPKLYDACHLIEVAGKDKIQGVYDVRAATVLQTDFIARDRSLPMIEEDDIVVIRNTGAYGMVMASGFPGCIKPKEIMISSFADIL
ncbi:alanine racemase [Carboxylicivirga marina]|uniref:Alanine racemase n=1 Tax=Carboxylicivirga marina TaxID=2800988 RepID=A0ABS1HEQ4_9BACT|nr:alanine racemase [Carboxylicivirga marina]MBK3516117.1 alanine racemase [Carboxylicivirga marina]